MARDTLTRGRFLKRAGAGAAGAALLGTSVLGSACSSLATSGMNAVVVILDSLRKDHVGAYGNDWIRTPALDALAKESLRFERAYPEAMPTIPARRAIHTGMRTFPFQDWEPNELGSRNHGWSEIPSEQRTLAEILSGAGYATGLVTDTYVQFPMNFSRGFDEYRQIRGQENDPYRDPATISKEWMRDKYLINEPGKKARQYLANTRGRKSEEDWFAPRVFLDGMDLLAEASRAGRPFFAVVDCFDPHEPWDPPEKYTRLYDPEGYEGKEPLSSQYGKDDYLTDGQLQRMKALYSGEVTMADHWLGNFMNRAEELGLMESTLFVFISDHGHALGEHGYTGKPAFALWPELTDIMFMIRHPEGKGAGGTSDFFASTYDVTPTILGTLGVEPPYAMDGQDLSPLLGGADVPAREYLTSAYGDYVWARDEERVMFARHDGAERRLYDARNDPRQQRDLSEDEPEKAESMYRDYVSADAGSALIAG